MASFAKMSLKPTVVRGAASSRRTVVVIRAQHSNQPGGPQVPNPTEVVKGKTETWETVAANARNEVADAAAGPVPAAPLNPAVSTGSKAWSLGDAMQFSGPAPELINGRLAMLGIVAALAAEISTGQSVTTQFQDAPLPIILAFATFIAASLVPLVKGVNPKEAFGIFNPKAEKVNGRAAMIGFAALLAVEFFKGSALI